MTHSNIINVYGELKEIQPPVIPYNQISQAEKQIFTLTWRGNIQPVFNKGAYIDTMLILIYNGIAAGQPLTNYRLFTFGFRQEIDLQTIPKIS
jgi:hypothetical protein